MKTYLFCYGSNNPQQLADRIGRTVKCFEAYAPGYGRFFRGMSQKWGGGTATLLKEPDLTTYGFLAEVTDVDLRHLDRFEGVGLGIYERKKLVCYDSENKKYNAIAYFSCKDNFNRPSREYLEACAKTVGTFWSGQHGKVTWRDFPIR